MMIKKNMTIWLTGRPCSGKTSLSVRLKEELEKRKIPVISLDGDVVRDRLNSDLGFSENDRRENLRRVAHVAQLFNENGIFVVATFITPTNYLRKLVRGIVRDFKMCYVHCPAEICEKRDVKGMYKKARAGIIKDFTGVSAPFEEPEDPEIIVHTDKNSLEQCVLQILEKLE